MSKIAFIDTEIDVKSKQILDIGCTTENGEQFRSGSVPDFFQYIRGVQVCMRPQYPQTRPAPSLCSKKKQISRKLKLLTPYTFLPYCFHESPTNALLKDDKLQTDELNNPLNDAIKAKDLFFDEVTAFNETTPHLKQIYFKLLGDKKAFASFFSYIGFTSDSQNTTKLILDQFSTHICGNVDVEKLIIESPVELAYCLALINTHSRYSITPPWVLKNYPDIERVMYLLRSNPCLVGCAYCNQFLDEKIGLKKYFGFDSYRTYAGESLQEKAVKAAINNKSLLAVFPTGGGKSVTFQVPALMSGENVKGLTVVISRASVSDERSG